MDEFDERLAIPRIPEPTPPVVVVPGASLLVGSDGGILDLRVTACHEDGSFTARADRLHVRGGLRIDGRVHDGVRAWRLSYVVESAEAISASEAEVQVRLVESSAMADERTGARVPHEALGSVRLRSFDGYDIAPTQVRTIDVSATGIAFECETRFERGQSLDFAFVDEVGQTIACRLEVVRNERGMFGRTRTMGRITAISGQSERLLEALVARGQLRGHATSDQPGDIGSLRDQLLDTRPKGIKSWLRRSA